MKNKSRKKGVSTLAIVFIMSLTILAFGSMLTVILNGEQNVTFFRSKEKKAFYLAEAGLEKGTAIIQLKVKSDGDILTGVDYLRSLQNTFITDEAAQSGSYVVRATTITSDEASSPYIPTFRQVIITSEGESNGKITRITSIQEFGYDRPLLFNYGMFINNPYTVSKTKLFLNGDMGANGDITYQVGDTIVSGQLDALGNVITSAEGWPKGWSFNDYTSTFSREAARPDNTEGGYTVDPDNPGTASTTTKNSGVDEFATPLIDQNYYKYLATTEGGYLKTIVNGTTYEVFDGIWDTEPTPYSFSDVHLVDGPSSEVYGIIVVEGDLLIRGTIEGQGTLYSTRNTHIIGDLHYKSPQVWPKPFSDLEDETQEQIISQNMNKDFLGLMARGNVIIGDPFDTDFTSQLHPLIQGIEGTTQPHFVPNQDDLGYSPFDGDYVGNHDSYGYLPTNPMLSYEDFQSLNPTMNITNIDGMLYTDHLLGAYFPYNGTIPEINGGVFARDLVIPYEEELWINYDYRASINGRAFLDNSFPVSIIHPPRKIYWAKEDVQD